MSTVFRAFSLPAHAKLNLRLEVGPKAYELHRVVSVFAELELADVVRFVRSDGGLQVLSEGVDLAERDNLAWRAAQALGPHLPDVRITVEKNIPMQAGLGGGSSDAAATLLGLAAIATESGVTIPHERLAGAALQAGSDVPSFLAGGLRIVSGVGDVVARRPCAAPLWGIALVLPDARSSTAHAYALLDAAGLPHDLGTQAHAAAEAMCAAFCAGDFSEFIALLHNDFGKVIEQAMPPVARARELLAGAGARGTILCGSGSCVAGFFESETLARDAVQRIPRSEGEWVYATAFSNGRP